MSPIKKSVLIFECKDPKKIKKSPVLFLDRDGVIIEDCHYIKDPKKVKLCIGAKKLIRFAYNKNIPIVIITNQSGISRNLLSWEDFRSVNKAMIKKLGSPNPISAIYANSYINDKSKENWRKPNPSMIFKAITDLSLNIDNSIIIGDRKSDIICGLRAGIKNLIHVQTGHGIRERKDLIYDIKNKSIDLNKSNLQLINNLNEFPFNIF
tara:strand:- start:2059 stop:2682 length:624 start_codon:yes stop_codon:yes gene_type:complete